ncbi:MAG: alpha/beta fold hydrolase [Hyphomicrobiaceae bacterium]
MAATDPDRDFEMRLADGRRLCWREYGVGDGQPVLALHGTPGSRLKYRFVHATAGQLGLRLITPDRWGYGLTDQHPRPSLVAYAEDAVQLMAHCGSARFAVVGISGGGPFAAALSARYPDKVTGLALVAPVARVATAQTSGPISRFHALCFRVLPKVPGAVRLIFELFRAIALCSPSLAMRIATLRAGPADRELMRTPALRQMVGTTFAEGLRRRVNGAVTDMDLFARAWQVDPADVQCPVTVWTGGDDRNVPIAAAQRLCQEMPHAKNIHRPDFGHLWISRNFDPVLEWLADDALPEEDALS